MSANEPKLQFKIGIRSDVFRRLEGNEDTRDKLESNIIPISWNSRDILEMLAHRVRSFLGDTKDYKYLLSLDQETIGELLNPVFEKRFLGSGGWH